MSDLKSAQLIIQEAQLNHKLHQEQIQAQKERTPVLSVVCNDLGIDWIGV